VWLVKQQVAVAVLVLACLSMIGCDQQAPDKDAGKVPLEVRQAEAMDGSRLDAAADSVVNDSVTPAQEAAGNKEASGE